jgi:membrane protease YdiL (CAAX protease family)
LLDRLKTFALRHPLWFGFLLIVIYALLTALTYPIHFLFPDSSVGILYGDIASRVVISGVFVALIWRFGWLQSSGLGRLRLGWAWLVILVVLLYKTSTELYAFTGSPVPAFFNSSRPVANWSYYFFGALIEELIARSLVLLAMLAAWGESKGGLFKSVLYSSLVFGAAHLFNAINTPVGLVVFQAMLALIPGILYAALFLVTRSLWPAIILHWVTNALVNAKIAAIPSYTETPAVWTWWGLALVPLLVFSFYLVWRAPHPYTSEAGELRWAA